MIASIGEQQELSHLSRIREVVDHAGLLLQLEQWKVLIGLQPENQLTLQKVNSLTVIHLQEIRDAMVVTFNWLTNMPKRTQLNFLNLILTSLKMVHVNMIKLLVRLQLLTTIILKLIQSNTLKLVFLLDHLMSQFKLISQYSINTVEALSQMQAVVNNTIMPFWQ